MIDTFAYIRELKAENQQLRKNLLAVLKRDDTSISEEFVWIHDGEVSICRGIVDTIAHRIILESGFPNVKDCSNERILICKSKFHDSLALTGITIEKSDNTIITARIWKHVSEYEFYTNKIKREEHLFKSIFGL